MSWIGIGVFLTLGLITGFGLLILNAIVCPKNPRSDKLDTYECGVPLLSDSRERFSVHFYLVAIMFMLFDIEAAFIIPWAVIYKKLGMLGFIEALTFMVVLIFGLIYIYARGVLDWDNPESNKAS